MGRVRAGEGVGARFRYLRVALTALRYLATGNNQMAGTQYSSRQAEPQNSTPSAHKQTVHNSIDVYYRIPGVYQVHYSFPSFLIYYFEVCVYCSLFAFTSHNKATP